MRRRGRRKYFHRTFDQLLPIIGMRLSSKPTLGTSLESSSFAVATKYSLQVKVLNLKVQTFGKDAKKMQKISYTFGKVAVWVKIGVTFKVAKQGVKSREEIRTERYGPPLYSVLTSGRLCGERWRAWSFPLCRAAGTPPASKTSDTE